MNYLGAFGWRYLRRKITYRQTTNGFLMEFSRCIPPLSLKIDLLALEHPMCLLSSRIALTTKKEVNAEEQWLVVNTRRNDKIKPTEEPVRH